MNNHPFRTHFIGGMCFYVLQVTQTLLGELTESGAAPMPALQIKGKKNSN